jgi:hypothetical protein
MRTKWVDNEVYFGPDRRRRDDGKKRWQDRRRYNDAAEPPPLGAVLRRLRVLLAGGVRPDERRHVLDLAKFALSEAERQHVEGCVEELTAALKDLMAGAYDAADAHIVEAQTHANLRDLDASHW